MLIAYKHKLWVLPWNVEASMQVDGRGWGRWLQVHGHGQERGRGLVMDLGHRIRGHILLVDSGSSRGQDKIAITIGRGVIWRWNFGYRFDETQFGLFAFVPAEDTKLNGLVTIMNFVDMVISFITVHQSFTSRAFEFSSVWPPFRRCSPFGWHY